MKKILFLSFIVLYTNFLMAQSIAVNTGFPNTEVGIANTFYFTLNPGASTGNTHYRIDNWLIIANISSGTIAGNIAGQSSSNYYYTPPLNQISSLSNNTTINIPVTYGSNAPDTDNMEIQVSGFYGIMVDNVFLPKYPLNGKYTKSNGDSGYTVDVKTVCGPAISNPTILACSTDNVQICASSYCDANSFAWSITGGSIVSGQGSSCITVSPTGNNNLSATCIAKRSSGLSSYTATNTRTITRLARSVDYTTADTKNWLGIGAGRNLSVPSQDVGSSIVWTAPGCTIAGQGTTSATITPTTAVAAGSVVNVYATVTYTGGCTAQTPVKSYTVFGTANPPLPVGYVTSTPDDGDVCHATSFYVDFVGQNISYWPVTVSPRVVFASTTKAITKPVLVSYLNPFTGIKTSQNYGIVVPAPCVSQTAARLASTDGSVATGVAFFPNPTQGNFTISLGKEASGNYEIYDAVGTLIRKQNFNKESSLAVELDSKLKNGYYYILLNTDDTTLNTKQTIVLQR